MFNLLFSVCLTSLLVLQLAQSQPSLTKGDIVVAAGGDIACDPNEKNYNQGLGTATNCQMKATSDLVLKSGITAVLPLGDNQYADGTFKAFQASYHPTWGQFKNISYPAVGNHEYHTKKASGYYKYFGKRAGDPAKGYYSYNLGTWHLIVLNSNCSEVGGCDENSPQVRWLKTDLAAHKNQCTLAYWHHPRFSSGTHGSNSTYDTFWKTLYQAGVEVVLNGHEHNYERFAPQSPDSKLDEKKGIRQFVVGTGGKSLYPFKTILANSQVRNAQTYGILKLTLKHKSYSWQFVPVPGKNFTDSGSGRCH